MSKYIHTNPLSRNNATSREKRLFGEAALRALCSRFAVPKTPLHKPLASLQPRSRKPRIHMLFGAPCTGKTALSRHLVRGCRRGATLNLDYDDAVLDNPAFMALQKAMATGYNEHASMLGAMTDKVSGYWHSIFLAAAESAVAHR